MNDEIYCFKSPGLATNIMHKKKASEVLKVVNSHDEDENLQVDKIGKKIREEIKQLPKIKTEYPVLNEETLKNTVIPTLHDLLSCISPKFESNPLVLALISNIVTITASSNASMLQISLGLLIREKKLIEHLHELGVTSSYDEVRRFKISAAKHATDSTDKALDTKEGLVQGSSDNFDASLSTQNGMKQTHSLATVILQNCNSTSGSTETRAPISRLKKEDLSTVKLHEPESKVFKGEKKPKMPEEFVIRGVLPLKLLCKKLLATSKSKLRDFQFVKDIIHEPNVPDFSGYNTKHMRENGKTVKTKTKVIYKPLVNKTPSDPSTILTAMCDVEKACEKSGQKETVFTCDQQLYRVTMDIIWNDPQRWANFYPRLGGMHWLMSFVGSVGKLMKNSGLDRLMKAAFAGVEKMLVGKKFPMNVRALRIVVIELLRTIITKDTSRDDMVSTLKSIAKESLLAKHWIDNLIYPVFLMMMYIRAEREGEFGLHLYCCKKMIPYFFAAGHWNYARDGIVYLMSMEKLPGSLMTRFLDGEHVVRVKDGLFNGIWSDMAIETTYMKVGKGKIVTTFKIPSSIPL